MTEVERPRLNTAVRWGQVYGIDVIDHDSWINGAPVIVMNDYVGQSRQKRRARENQHRDNQPFSDLIVGSPRVLWEGMCTDEQLDEMERRFIQDVPIEQRPRLNYLLNEDNPRRIPKWTLKEQRHARDAVRGDSPWEPTPYRPQVYAPAPTARKAVKPWRPWQKHLLGVTTTWLTLSAAGWVLLGWQHHLTDHTALATPVVALLVGAHGWFGFPGVGKRWRRRYRNARKRFR